MKFLESSVCSAITATLLLVALFSNSVFAEGELLVVSYKQDLFATNPHGKNLPIVDEAALEAACVAMALAHNMQAAYKAGQAPHPVAVFPSLGGVKLANERLLIETGLDQEECPIGKDMADPDYPEVPLMYKALGELVRDFIGNDGQLVICPLCWNNRGYDNDDMFDGAILDQAAIGGLFFSPGKSIDF